MMYSSTAVQFGYRSAGIIIIILLLLLYTADYERSGGELLFFIFPPIYRAAIVRNISCKLVHNFGGGRAGHVRFR